MKDAKRHIRTKRRFYLGVVRDFTGILIIATAVLLTMANSAGPRDYYERELITGNDFVVQDYDWEDAAGCLPPISLKKTAMRVSIVGSRDNEMASMVCDDGTNCIDKVTSFANCVANVDLRDCSQSMDSVSEPEARPDVSCESDEEAAANTEDCDAGGFRNVDDIRKCNDEMTIHVEYEDGSEDRATFRQLYVEEDNGGYGCNYPG